LASESEAALWELYHQVKPTPPKALWEPVLTGPPLFVGTLGFALGGERQSAARGARGGGAYECGRSATARSAAGGVPAPGVWGRSARKCGQSAYRCGHGASGGRSAPGAECPQRGSAGRVPTAGGGRRRGGVPTQVSCGGEDRVTASVLNGRAVECGSGYVTAPVLNGPLERGGPGGVSAGGVPTAGGGRRRGGVPR
jgi:hypothetical protein